MKRILDRLMFRPRLLPKALERVEKEHPNRLEESPSRLEELASPLRDRVRQCDGDPSCLRQLRGELTLSQLRVLVRFSRQDPELRDSLAPVLTDPPVYTLAREYWRSVETLPKSPIYWRLLGDALETDRELSWLNPDWKQVLAGAAAAPDPAGHLIQLADRHDYGIEGLTILGGSPFRTDTRILEELGKTRLMASSAEAIRLDSLTARLGWWSLLQPAERERAGRNYLRVFRPPDWEMPVLTEIKGSFGIPRSHASRAGFWEDLRDEIQQAFRKVLLAQQLDEFFKGDSERHRYWKSRWLDRLLDVRTASAGATQYAVLDFGAFGVVEFFEVGNAAYFYPRSDLERIEARRVSHPSDLKQRERYRIDFPRDNRLIHSGRWFRKADRRMYRWLRSFDAR